MKYLTNLLMKATFVCSLAIAAGGAQTQAAESTAKPSAVTAIDILLEPDATMLRYAEAVNASHLKIYPKGFALDESHRPHITIIQRFVRTADLDQVYAAAGKVLARANATAMKLEAFKFYYVPTKDLGLSGIVARPTPELLKLQEDIIAAVAPFTVETGAEVASRRRRSCGDPIRTATRHAAPLAAQTFAAAHDQDRRSRHGQQDGADRLGADGARRRVSRAAATSGIRMSGPMSGALHEVGEG